MICTIIYKITNLLTEKVYIGQTVRPLEDRIGEHCRHQRTLVEKAVHKYGIESFRVEVIDTAETIEELNEKEIYWIAFYDCITPKGYNQCNGGDNTMGYHHRQSSKAIMSAAKKDLFIGEGNPFYGKRHSTESKALMSEKRKGLKHLTSEQVKRLRESHSTKKVQNVETGEIFNSVKEAAEKYGLKATHITRVCKGKRSRTGGYHWQYYNA